jgi:UDP-N-acetyl-D-mannosaminuronic acid dehydrogenase
MGQQLRSVCVVGIGYIGLPTAVALATRGIQVVGYDVSERTVQAVNDGRSPIVEPDLAAELAGAVAKGALRASLEPEPADAFIIAVPTPFGPEHQPDLEAARAATRSIAPVLSKGALVVVESTCPPGTTEELSGWLAELRPDLRMPHEHPDDPDVNIAYCPERVLPGRIMIELITNDRTVGGITEHCAERAKALYEVFCEGEIFTTSARTAEMVKLSENAYRDVNIAFANELSLVCDALGIDVWEVIQLANRHPRVQVLSPGPGVGGHCIAVDPWFIIDAAPDESRLMRTAREVNDGKPQWVVDQVMAAAATLAKPVVACLGLAFKADVDDLRESPAVSIVEQLAGSGVGTLLVVEPHIAELPPRLAAYDDVRLVSLDEALSAADVVVNLVDHAAFRALPPARLSGKQVVDTRGTWR